MKTKIDRLTDGYLSGSFELAEYQETKNRLMSEKKTLDEQLSDFERKGNRWLGLMRNWIIEANQALNLAETENLPKMRDFLTAIGSNRRLASGTLSVDFQKPFSYLAETRERTRSVRDNFSSNSDWWTDGESNPLEQDDKPTPGADRTRPSYPRIHTIMKIGDTTKAPYGALEGIGRDHS